MKDTLGDALDRALGGVRDHYSHNCTEGHHHLCTGYSMQRTCRCACHENTDYTAYERVEARRRGLAHLLRQVRMVGRYDWLGGYTHAVVMGDGELLGPECVRPNYRLIREATRHGDKSGWEAVAVIALDNPDSDDHCAHCNKELT